MRADLHLHSHYSDGSEPPAKVIERARAGGLTLIALADHDTMGGWAEARPLAEQAGLRLLPAAEFTAQFRGREIHLLGYFAAPPGQEVLRHLEGMQQFRRRRLETAMAGLRRLGLRVELEELPRAPCCQSVTTAHLTRLLTERGYAPSVQAARRRFLSREPGLVPAFEVGAAEVINVIHADRGLAVWAHPGRKQFRERLEELAAFGLDGIEAANGRRGLSVSDGELTLARSMNLVTTGGSDWHGDGPLGEFAAEEPVLEAFLQRLSRLCHSASELRH
ncbi:MAG: PHP domain-containing protein [Terriglobia bacterium]